MTDATDRRRLGCAALWLSPVTFGAMTIGRPVQADADRIATLRAAVDAGITSIDTAPLYGFGRSEELVGAAIRGMRDTVQVLTKVGLRWDDPHGELLFAGPDAGGRRREVRRNSRPESVRREVDASLRRLGVERLDLVQVHHRDTATPIAETMGALLELRAAGKLREIGVANYTADEVAEAVAALGEVPLASVQSPYSLIRRDVERDVLPAALRRVIGFLCYSPLEQSLLTERLLEGRLAADDPRRRQWAFQPVNARPVARALQETLLPIALGHEATIAQVSLAWLLAQPGVTSVIAGASSAEQAESNARAAALSLADAEVTGIRSAFEALELDRSAGPTRAQVSLRRARARLGRLRRKFLG